MIDQIKDYIINSSVYQLIISEDSILQFSCIILIFAFSYLFRKFLLGRKFLAFVKEEDKLTLLSRLLYTGLYPLFVYVFIYLSATLLSSFDIQIALLVWVQPLVIIWLLYRLITTILIANMSVSQAKFWHKSVLNPILIFTIILSVLGLLDPFLGFGLPIENLNTHITIKSILIGLLIFFAFHSVSKFTKKFLTEYFLPKAGTEPALTQGISKLVTIVIMIIGITLSLGAMGINLTALTVVVGGLSVGLGFGLQSIVSNFVSGFILLFEKSLSPGDVIKIGDITGAVENIGIRSIRILTKDNVELIIPNSYYIESIVTNMTRTEKKVRFEINVGVSYSSDPKIVEKVLLQAVDFPAILERPRPVVQFVDFGDSSLNFRLLVWTDQAFEITMISSMIRFQIWELFKSNNIEIPFPQRDIHIRSTVNDSTKKDLNEG